MTSINPPEEQNPGPALDPELNARIQELQLLLEQNEAQRKSILMELHHIAVTALGIPPEQRDFTTYQSQYVYGPECWCGCPDNCVDCANTVFVADLESDPKRYILLHGLEAITEWMDKFFTEYMQNVCACRMSIAADGTVTCRCRLGTNPTFQATTWEDAQRQEATLEKVREAGLTPPQLTRKPVTLNYTEEIAKREAEAAAPAPEPAPTPTQQPRTRDRDIRRRVNEALRAHGPMTAAELSIATNYSSGQRSLAISLSSWPETQQDAARRWTLRPPAPENQAPTEPEPEDPSAPAAETPPAGQDDATEPPVHSPGTQPVPDDDRGIPPSSGFTNTPEGVRQAAAEILAQARSGHPMPERTLYSRLLDRSFPTGEDQPIHQYRTHLANDPRFREEPEGHWTLQAEG